MKRFLVPCLVFLTAGLYYLIQACPTFYFWDSAELTAAVLSGGVPHPPGFPFFLILAKLWSLILPVNKAYGLNLFSVFFGALGLTLWYLVIQKILSMIGPAKNAFLIFFSSIPAIFLFCVSLSYGIQATRFEVYSLNFTGFAAICLLAMTIIEKSQTRRRLIVLLFVFYGLSLGVHNLTIGLTIPGTMILLISQGKIKIRQAILGLTGSAVIALSFYIAIYVRAAGHPILNWGDPSNIGRLIDFILVRGFSTSPSGMTADHFIDLADFVSNIYTRQLGIIGLLFAIIGAVFLYLRWRILAISLGVTLLLNSISVVFGENYFYENYDLHGYLIISVAILILLLASGIMFIIDYLQKKINTKSSPTSAASSILAAIIVIMAVGPSIKDNFFAADLSKVNTAEIYASRFLDDAPANSIIITSSYNTYFCVLARQSVVKNNKMQILFNLYDWDHQWGMDEANQTLRSDIRTNLDRQKFYRDFLNRHMKVRPIYIEYDEASIPLTQYLLPKGLGYILDTSKSPGSGQAIEASYIRSELDSFGTSHDIESVRTEILWLQCRARYYEQKADSISASEYYQAIDSLASKVQID